MFSNKYIFIYATILTVVVAAALAFTSQQLKPIQNENIRIEKMQYILASANINSTVKNAAELYKKYITKTEVINHEGNIIPDANAFEVDLAAEMKLPPEKRKIPVYYCTFDNNEKGIIFQLSGKGLWGPLWGYLCFKEDMNTLLGAIFDHKGETPGLGAEISNTMFSEQFRNKMIFDKEGKFCSINVIKGGAAPEDLHGVDAITGGTITSNGVSLMIRHSLEQYLPFIEKNKLNSTSN